MSSIPVNPAPSSPATPAPSPATLPSRAMGAPAAGPVAGAAALDPVKLLNRYKWALAIAAIAGAAVGIAAHYTLRSLRPVWTPAALFTCTAPTANITDIASTGTTEEMVRFMQTQVRIITSDQVLQRVVEDPSLLTNCPNWTVNFRAKDQNTGVEAFDTVEAMKELRENVRARVVSGTNLIEVSMGGRHKYDTTEIIRLVKEKYLAVLGEQGRTGLDDKIAQSRAMIDRMEKDAQSLAQRKQTLIAQRNVDALDNRTETTRSELMAAGGKLIDLQQDLEAGRTRLAQMESEWNNPGGIEYGADLRERVERDPAIAGIRTEIQNYESAQQALLNLGYSREHRAFIGLQAQIDGANATLSQKRADQLKKLFAADLDSLRKTVAQFEAAEKNLVSQKTALQNRLTDLTRTQSEISDIDQQVKGLRDSATKANSDLQNLIAQAASSSVNRVRLLQAERPPSEMSFPKIRIMLPAGVVLFVGATAAFALLREIADQRVKGPSDVQLIPRTRLVGWIPDAADDPAGAGLVETAFRDRPRGILAESFRQVRGTIAKRLQSAGHTTLVVMSGMPASGATSVAANLAIAFAAADKRVLLIDANFRRPALHRVFGLPEAPGLADVLGKSATLAQAAQASTTPNLDLLCAGAKDQRVFERLANEAMTQVLADAKAAYDLVIVDVAPVVVAGDAMALAHRADASLLVVRAMADKRGMVARIKNELTDHKSEFLGVVVNGVKASAGGYMKRNIQTAHEYQAA